MRFDLSDEEWAVIEPLLPPRVRGPLRVDDRKILNGYSTFCAQVPLGATCLSATARAPRYARWTRRGVWRDIFEALARNGEDSFLFIDASIVKAHRAATGAKGGLAQDNYAKSKT